MSANTSSLNTSNAPSQTKSRSNEEEGGKLKKSSSDRTINNERIFGSLEELMSYIGSSYPYYRHTVLPLILTSSFLFLTSRFLFGMNKVKNISEEGEFFYSKCQVMNGEDDSMEVAKTADFMPGSVPRWELAIVMNAILMFSTTTVSPRHLALLSMVIISICYFVMAHFPLQLQMSMFISQMFTEIYRMVAMVTIAESVPKFHRMPALVLLEFAYTAPRILANVLVRLPSDIPMNMSYCFEIFGFATVFVGFVTYYTFHDSLYSLLARSKTDEMQARVTEIFKRAGISLAPDAVIDQIAFENFENNGNAIEILIRTLKTFKLLQEVVVCGVISGVCLAVNAFMEAEMVKHSEVMFFERAMIPTVSYTVSGVLLMILCILLPKHRILPVIIIIPILYLSTTALLIIPDQFRVFDSCKQQYMVKESVFPFHFAIGVLVSAFTDMIRFFIKVHLMEVMPVLIRTAIIAVLYFVQYSFDGNVRDLYSTEAIDGHVILVIISVLSMLILLITPRKKNYMNVFFSEYTKDDKKRSIPPAPEFEK